MVGSAFPRRLTHRPREADTDCETYYRVDRSLKPDEVADLAREGYADGRLDVIALQSYIRGHYKGTQAEWPGDGKEAGDGQHHDPQPR